MTSQRLSFALKAIALLALPFALTGCSNMVTTASVSAPSSSSTITGKMHGGNQPIFNAAVNLYAAGTTGYGSGSTLLASTSTDTYGAFSFNQLSGTGTNSGNSYYCPSANSQLYIVGSGGNTLGTGDPMTNNAASVLMATIGKCSAASSVYVYINEITTIATLAALQQYINPGGSTPGSMTMGTNGDYTSSSPVQAGIGLNNAFAIVPLLVNYTNGNANATFTQQNTAGSAIVKSIVVTGTPEQAKIITMANILAACVNQTDNSTSTTNGTTTTPTGCGTLFTNAVPPNRDYTSQTGTAYANAVDTLQAGYFMLTNPTDNLQPATASVATTTNSNTSLVNLTNLYNLATPMPPFQTGLGAVPTDWTIGIGYSVVGTATAASQCNNAYFINYGYGTGIDASGNIWMANGGTSGVLAQMSPVGLPLNCSSAKLVGARGGASIDLSGNIWGSSNTSGSGNFIRFDGTTTTTFTLASTDQIGTITPDGYGNVIFSDSTTALIYQLPIGATSATGAVSLGTAPVSAGNNVTSIAVDGQNSIFTAGNNSSKITAFIPKTAKGTTYGTAIAITNTANNSSTLTPLYQPYGLAVDGSGNVWSSQSNNGSSNTVPGNSASQLVPTYNGAAGSYTATFGFQNQTGTGQAGFQTPRQIAIDGAGNVWLANNSANMNAAGSTPATTYQYAIAELTKNGAALSPTQFTGPGQNGGYIKPQTIFYGPRAIAIDLSGNIWLTETGTGSSPAVYQFAEVLGAAVPVATPLAAQAKGNLFGSKP